MKTLTLTAGMHELTPEATLSDVIEQIPGAVSTFECLGVDYACHGLTPLHRAARDAGIPVGDLMSLLEINRPVEEAVRHSLAEMARHLAIDHVRLFSQRVPEIDRLMEQFAGEHDPRAATRIVSLWRSLTSRMGAHASAEETGLFPLVVNLERHSEGDGPAPAYRIAQFVLHEHVEHAAFCDAFRTILDLCAAATGGKTMTRLRAELVRFRSEVHYHMHLENNVLYRRALELENRIRMRRAEEKVLEDGVAALPPR